MRCTPLVLALLALMACAARPPSGTRLPTRFVEDRFFVEPVSESGEKLVLYTDTGGGLFILADAVKRAGFAIESVAPENIPAAVPRWRPEAAVPAPADGPRIPVLPNGELQWEEKPFDGMLGGAWFGDRVWIFDYPGKQLWLRGPGAVPADAAHRVPLGFQTEGGKRTTHFPRFQVRIDGETLDLLFDTGATVHLSDEAVAALGDGRGAIRATSFIVATIFDRWHARHPEWRVIDKADRLAKGEPIIEVPAVEVAGYTVGPVWFTRRADRNFHEYTAQFMDKPIDGALGGTAFRFFRITVDYPNATATFEKP